MQIPPSTIIQGSKHSDERGTLSFWNDFDMQSIKRMYVIENADTQFLRGWRGHHIEQRWFYAMVGSFSIHLVQIDDWVSPKPTLAQISFELSEAKNTILHVPAGYASAIQALTIGAKLLVLGDHPLENAKNDDHLYPSNYFTTTT